MTALLDGNALVALVVAGHSHHEAVEEWFTQREGSFATCPVTQGTLARLLVRSGTSAAEAVSVVQGVTRHPDHEFWADDIGYDQVRMRGVIGHRQVTDAYLALLARTRSARLATLDHGLAHQHRDVAELIPTPGPRQE